MAKLVWDKTGERLYETGVKNCALYVYDAGTKAYKEGVAWNGITAITESPSGAEANPLYADDIKYLNLISNEDYACSIEAYMYPDAFAECNGEKIVMAGTGSSAHDIGLRISQQARSMFAIAYRTTVGNDVLNNEYGYKLHIVYNCLAAVSERAYTTINDSPEAMTFSWEVSTTPEQVAGYRPIAHMEIDSNAATSTHLAALEGYLFGTDASTGTNPTTDKPPKLLMPAQVIACLTDGTLPTE